MNTMGKTLQTKVFYKYEFNKLQLFLTNNNLFLVSLHHHRETSWQGEIYEIFYYEVV